MVIDVKSIGSLKTESLCELARSLPVPALLTDSELKLVIKNDAFTGLVSGLRKGSSISRFLKEGTDKYIKEMLPSEVFATRFRTKNDNLQGVLILSGIENRLVIFNSIASDMFERIEDIYSRMSGFDNAKAELEIKNDIERTSGKGTAELIKILSKMLEEIRTVRSLPFFNASNILSAFRETLSKSKYRFVFEQFPNDTITQGNAQDLALILAFVLSFCAEHSDNSPIIIQAEKGVSETVFTVRAQTTLSVYDAAKMTAIYKFDENEEDGRNFWFYMLRLLADANLWSFRTTAVMDGSVIFSLTVPSVQSVEECLLREAITEQIITIINAFFA